MMGARELWAAALRPQRAFPPRAAQPVGPGAALAGMLAWRLPLGVLGALATARGLLAGLAQFRRLEGSLAQTVLGAMPEVAPEDLKAALANLPPFPTLYAVLPWILLLVPLGLLGAWLHHSAWDHGCLWLWRGLRKEHPWKATFEAEAVALQVGAVGVALGLVTLVPVVGPFLWPLTLTLDLWFWCLRGVALAAFHGCPLWKGVAATLLHGVLVMLLACGLLVFALFVVGV